MATDTPTIGSAEALVGTRTDETSPLHTTRRGMAAASLCFGFWSGLVFWWYPYSIFIAVVGLTLGVVAKLMGVKVERHGADLAVIGIVLNSMTLGTTFAVYRMLQFYFEGQPAYMPLSSVFGGN